VLSNLNLELKIELSPYRIRDPQLSATPRLRQAGPCRDAVSTPPCPDTSGDWQGQLQSCGTG